MSDLTEVLPERFASAYLGLVSADLRRELLGSLDQKVSAGDLAYLIGTASRFALKSEFDSQSAGAHCQIAYDIAVRAPRFANGSSGIVLPLCEGILSRIGNFPARALLRESHADIKRVEDPFLELEAAVREEENKSQETPDGFILTDFQVRLLKALRDTSTVSVSAPTSAGKSFTLELELLYRLTNAGSYTAIFLVPTRALIRQVSVDLMELFRGNNIDCSVLSSLSVPEDENPDKPRRLVFVLTQERFATLLAEAPVAFTIDAIIVDEAQEIGKDRRGMTLERVVRLAMRRFPHAQLFFSSPLRSNPEYLLSLFERPETSSTHFVEYQRPVSQNIILVKPVKGKTSSAALEVLSDVGPVSLGVVDMPFKFRDRYLVNLAKHFTAPDDVSIIYCNRPSAANKAATELSDIFEEKGDDELDAFADFLQQEVHRYYRLGSMVRRGIAFHYANIPQIVRSRIEELAKDRKLKFICCTSTLLQGVNLPAKNIFLENPKTGQGDAGKIKPGDFWNLVGRAGRMNHEFSGNVFCIYGKAWDSDPLSGDRLMPIESAFQVALTERAEELGFFAKKPPLSADSSSEAWAEQAFANIYSDYVSTKARLSDAIDDPTQKALLAVIDTVSERVYSERTLPDDLFTKNMYVHPDRLEELARLFRNTAAIGLLCPLQPFAEGAYQNLSDIFGVIDLVFIKAGNQRHRYFAFLALEWMKGMPIRDLVKARLDYKSIPDDEKQINEEITDLFREIEDDLRYKYVKYTSIYLQVLALVLGERGETEKAEKLLPLHLFLEFGAADKVLISLMSLGLSRTSAILLKRTVSLRSDMTFRECKDYLDAVNLTRIAIPEICKAEIARLRGKASR